MKEAILLAAFGTSVPEAESAYNQIESLVRQEFPDVEIRWAYSSRKIRKKFESIGKQLPSPELEMARMMQDRLTHVSVFSLHVIPGIEFHELQMNVSLFGRMVRGIEHVVVSKPLLSSHEDCKRVARILLSHLPERRDEKEAVLFMGHGTAKHPAYAIYYALDAAFQELDRHVYVGCVMGVPDLQELVPRLSQAEIKKVHLVPLMAVAGEHARNDMAGDGPDSWKSILESTGITCEVNLTGIAEYPEIVDIWIDHLKEARRELVG